MSKKSISFEIFQMHISDPIAYKVVDILDKNHDKRIKQKTLDFYRTTHYSLLNRGGTMIFLVAMRGRIPIGFSGCGFGFKSKKMLFSTTVVDKKYRKQGVATALLSAKLVMLKQAEIEYIFNVHETNIAAIGTCKAAKLKIIDEKYKDDGTRYMVFV